MCTPALRACGASSLSAVAGFYGAFEEALNGQ